MTHPFDKMCDPDRLDARGDRAFVALLKRVAARQRNPAHGRHRGPPVRSAAVGLLAAGGLFAALPAAADVVADWAYLSTEIATDGPNTVRTMALTQSAVYEAVNAITQRYPRDRVDLGSVKGASIDAAVASASRTILLHEAPDLRELTEANYGKILKSLPDDAAREAGVNLGVRAAEDVLSKHTDDLGSPQPIRPLTKPGVYIPTPTLLGVGVSQHKPWFIKSNSALRPGPPPALDSAQWTADYNETKTLGAGNSTVRTQEQTEIARFWATALPDVHVGVLRAVANGPGREVTRNARLFAAATAAMNDAEITVFEAKYHYTFWRPVTAIRNGDDDGNPATERDPAWVPMIAVPLQPEYPCGHCILAASIETVIKIETSKGPPPELSSVSNTAPGVTRRWKTPDEVIEEVSNARIWSGVHFRSATVEGNKMGRKIAEEVAAAYHLP